MSLTFRTLLLLAALAIAAWSYLGPAQAATVRAVSQVKVDAGDLRLTQLFSGVSALEDRVIGQAPSYGKMLKLTADNMLRIAKAYKLDWQPAQGEGFYTTVLRASRSLDASEINRQLKTLLLENLPEVDAISINMPEAIDIKVPRLRATAPIISNLSVDQSRGIFSAQIVSESDDQGPRISTNVSGSFKQLKHVPVLIRNMARGKTIRAADIEIKSVLLTRIGANAVLDKADIIGQAAKRSLTVGRVIQVHDIAAPILVRRGESVSVRYMAGTLQLEARMTALEKGTSGDYINLRNPKSLKIIEARIIAPGRADAT